MPQHSQLLESLRDSSSAGSSDPWRSAFVEDISWLARLYDQSGNDLLLKPVGDGQYETADGRFRVQGQEKDGVFISGDVALPYR